MAHVQIFEMPNTCKLNLEKAQYKVSALKEVPVKAADISVQCVQ
jgi:hypothetical protein